ncbi:hypothetical protein LUX29_04165 [Aureimonas altamirensis]|uniref:hypothetical protein n=1 Tax=Aureimonas altamirensis TaxID=370622 RepID=UPI001E64CB16|nr:hypothetical protein [Aureimonas altamirensis]UHD46422.1 hypothetical protein LUX29_04165 [Aureimonas altamirensis]
MTRLIVSHYMPADHGTHRDFILPWTERVAGACPTLSFDIHCEGSSLGLLENQFDQVMSGAVDIAHSPANLPPGRFPLTQLINLPFLVENPNEAARRLMMALDGPLRAEFTPLNVLALHADSGGVLHMRDTRIDDVSDLAGKRIRSPAGATAEALAALGAEPVHLLPPAIGEAARSGAIDGAVMAWDVLAYSRTDEIFRHHYSDIFYLSPLYFVMNANAFARLTPDQRSALEAQSGTGLAARLGSYWDAWSAPGRALTAQEGHTLQPLPRTVLAALRAAAGPARERQVRRLIDAGHAEAGAVARMFDASSDHHR